MPSKRKRDIKHKYRKCMQRTSQNANASVTGDALGNQFKGMTELVPFSLRGTSIPTDIPRPLRIDLLRVSSNIRQILSRRRQMEVSAFGNIFCTRFPPCTAGTRRTRVRALCESGDGRSAPPRCLVNVRMVHLAFSPAWARLIRLVRRWCPFKTRQVMVELVHNRKRRRG